MPALLAAIPWFQVTTLELTFPPFAEGGRVVYVSIFHLLAMAGVVLALHVMRRAYARRGGDPEVGVTFYASVVVPSLVCAHVLNTVFYHPTELAEWFASARDGASISWPFIGMSSFGGFIGAFLSIVWWSRRRPEGLGPLLEASAYCFPFGWIIGRVGCFLVHDHPGRPTSFMLGVADFQTAAGPALTRHDLGLYEALWSVACALLFLVLERRPRADGFFVGLLLVAYMPLRFCLDFLRLPEGEGGDVRWGPLTMAQYACLPFLALGVMFLARARRAARRPEQP